jgi:hypothetical protein
MQNISNPWHDFPSSQPYLLSADKESVLKHNDRLPETHQIKHNVLPEPYLGNPDAPIVLLNQNPGYSEEDISFYDQEHVRELWRKNILHEPMKYPFWLIDTNLSPNIGGTRWWRQKLKEPIQIAGLEKVANRICCIEWFPYHSRKFSQPKTILASQQYSFDLVRRSITSQAVIILMRNQKLWLQSIPELTEYRFIFRLNNPQNVAISKNNCPEGFPHIVKALIT